jgi:hypothetical protein
MLVITANWALTDGSLWQPSTARHVRWLDDVHRAALRGGFGRDGIYRPIDAIDIVFAGDTFDFLASRRWTGAVKPWHGGPLTRTTRAAVMLAAARRSRHLFAALGRWTRHGLAVPAADRRGRPQPHLRQRADVRVTLLTGDRDHWLDEAAPTARRRGHTIGRTWATPDLVVHHGAEFDPLWTTGMPDGEAALREDERLPLLGESLAVDLVAHFAAAVLDQAPARAALRSLLATLGTSRLADLPGVLARWLAPAPGQRSPLADAHETVRSAWNRSLAAWHRDTSRRPPACGLEASPVDALAAWLEPGVTPTPRITATVAALEPRPGRAAIPFPNNSMTVHSVTVLGHVASPAAPGDATAASVICLGGLPARTVVRGRHDPSAWEPLEPEPASAAVIGLGAAAAGRSGDTVVDAIIHPAITSVSTDAVGHAA